MKLKKSSEIHDFRIGILNLFIKHTSASLTINENADQSVRNDFEYHFNKMVQKKTQIMNTHLKVMTIYQHI